MRGDAHGHAVEAGKREIGNDAVRLFREHERERPRPECGGKFFGGGGERAHAPRRGHIRDMGNQWIERGAALGRIEPCHGLAVAGIGAEPVDGFGRKGDEAAGGEAARGCLGRPAISLQSPRSWLGGHRHSQACV